MTHTCNTLTHTWKTHRSKHTDRNTSRKRTRTRKTLEKTPRARTRTHRCYTHAHTCVCVCVCMCVGSWLLHTRILPTHVTHIYNKTHTRHTHSTNSHIHTTKQMCLVCFVVCMCEISWNIQDTYTTHIQNKKNTHPQRPRPLFRAPLSLQSLHRRQRHRGLLQRPDRKKKWA